MKRHIGNTKVEKELYRGKSNGLVINAYWADSSGGNSFGYSYQLQLRTSNAGMTCPVLPDGRSLDEVLKKAPTLETTTEWNQAGTQCHSAADEEAIAHCVTSMETFLASLPLDQVTDAFAHS